MTPTNLTGLSKQLENLARQVAKTLNKDEAEGLLKAILPQSLTPLERNLSKILTVDTKTIQLKDKIRILYNKSQHNILIVGETGTGKELIARALHKGQEELFIAVNCAAINESLVESEFFGAKKGAYTGCTNDREGYFESAKDGTIFLDEISEIPLSLQAKLLRVIETRSYRRVGDTQERKIECRIVSATNIHQLHLKPTLFRNDLYYRLATVTLQTTPIRERKDDIKLITQQIDTNNKITDDEIHELQTMELKGNVRELKNKIEELLLMKELTTL